MFLFILVQPRTIVQCGFDKKKYYKMFQSDELLSDTVQE